MSHSPLLSIAIPAYDRPKELEFGLGRFIDQIQGKYEEDVEIIVSDDHSPPGRLDAVRRLAESYGFIRFRRYPHNIGLERNLIACTDGCRGEYLWIFGDDDFVETDDALDIIMAQLRSRRHDFLILNRTRRNFDLTKLISSNWMQLAPGSLHEFRGLRDFCIQHGFISVIGFISVNIFRRQPFQRADSSKYIGTMYPQLGTMVEVFHHRPTLLLGQPLICHRTQTPEEKKAALGHKSSEADFMTDVRRRNAIYFSHPYVAMLAELLRIGAFRPEDIMQIPENTVLRGKLVDFLIDSIALNREMAVQSPIGGWAQTRAFFASLPLDAARRERLEPLLTDPPAASGSRTESPPLPDALAAPARPASLLTISVITPSYNQGRFLAQCLESVRSQTTAPIEHLVYDPGSTDDSRQIASSFPHVTLMLEADEGQSHAVNKGFQRARGDIIAWINSDDYYATPHVFERVVRRFLEADAPDIVYGTGVYVDENGRELRPAYINRNPLSLGSRFQHEDGILQPALFMRRSVVERIGLLRSDLHYTMDYDYWIRCAKNGLRFAFMDEPLAFARYHRSNKTYGMRGASYLEICDLMKNHFGYCSHIWLRRYAEFLADGHDGVLATSANAGVQDAEALERIYRELLQAYNADYDTFSRLQGNAATRGYGDTLRAMQAAAVMAPVPVHSIPLEQAQEPGHVCYTVGPRRWAFRAQWKKDAVASTHAFFRRAIAARREDVCVVVGNGPSLNKTDFSLLDGRDVIISNNAFLSERLAQLAKYFTVVNYLVAEQSGPAINRLRHVTKVLPYWLSYCLHPGPDTYFVDAVGYPEFSRDIFKNMSWRHTVTFFNLHLAYGLGYRKVVLIGFDHSYKQADGVTEQQIIHSHEADENHFDPRYFRGKRWQAADVDMMEAMYRLAKAAYEEDGRVIVNATVGGNLELFPRETLDRALGAVR